MKFHRLFAATAGAVLATSMAPLTAFASAQTTYTVKPGDTYYKIGQAVHQPWPLLQAINSPHANTLLPGEVVRLAVPYTVQRGDTVWKIARAHHTTVNEVAYWNHLSHPSLIYPGTLLWLPPGTSQARTAPRTAAVGDAKIVENTVSYRLPPGSVPSGQTDTATQAVQPTPSVSREDIVNYAKRFLGVPYQYGGESSHGFDCSGFVQAVFSHFHINMPRTAAEQVTVGKRVSTSQLQPGDLVFFNTTGRPYSHDGIYIGDGRFISATTSHGVTISNLNNPYYWGPRFVAATNPLA
ncbi:C40 family peptidase [Alicyclobacillus macrosporangiidus]|uniref:C40 family peptidase n=1 Tax=Alicyclobacillus macrosporangiidus TaxID=392015 RepID=UPI0026EB9602|nr:C40 family peptidase [Alicyclobacillus macrosporangiidus]